MSDSVQTAAAEPVSDGFRSRHQRITEEQEGTLSETHSSPHVEEHSPAAFISMRLSEISTGLVTQWSRGHRSGARGFAGNYPSDRVLLVHIPLIIGSIGQYVRNPAFEVRQEILTHLSANGDVWRQLDYSTRELMAWLDGVSRLIMQRIQQEFARSERACNATLAMEAIARLSEGLRDMTSVILGLYLDRESDRHQELARQHADSSLIFAHEMRAPLHTISLSAAILEAPNLCTDPDSQQRQLKVIRSALAHAESLLQHADLVKGSENTQPLALTTPLQSVLESVTDELSARAMASGVELRLSDAAPPPLAVETVVAHLVLSNLVINAIKYSDQVKEVRWVTLRAEVTDGDDPRFVTVEVADNGIGIPASLQQHIFQRRFRAHPQVADGLGLGLAIARDVLADRGGSIDLISREQIGTAVRFRLPTSPIEAGVAQRPAPVNLGGRSMI